MRSMHHEGNRIMSDTALDQETLITLASDIVSAHVSNNTVASAELPGLIASVYSALARLGEPVVHVEERPAAAVSVRASVKPDYIVCLEDGKKMKMLKRHLMTDHGMTPARVPRALGSAGRLSDGVCQLFRAAPRAGKADRTWPQAGPKGWTAQEASCEGRYLRFEGSRACQLPPRRCQSNANSLSTGRSSGL